MVRRARVLRTRTDMLYFQAPVFEPNVSWPRVLFLSRVVIRVSAFHLVNLHLFKRSPFTNGPHYGAYVHLDLAKVAAAAEQ